MYGKGHFSFWQLEVEGGFLLKQAVSFEVCYYKKVLIPLQGRDKPKTILSLCFTTDGQVATGDSNGSISLWDANSYKMLKQVEQ